MNTATTTMAKRMLMSRVETMMTMTSRVNRMRMHAGCLRAPATHSHHLVPLLLTPAQTQRRSLVMPPPLLSAGKVLWIATRAMGAPAIATLCLSALEAVAMTMMLNRTMTTQTAVRAGPAGEAATLIPATAAQMGKLAIAMLRWAFGCVEASKVQVRTQMMTMVRTFVR